MHGSSLLLAVELPEALPDHGSQSICHEKPHARNTLFAGGGLAA
jgi:hypothetical protein